MKTTKSFTNLWHRKDSAYSKPQYATTADPVKTYRCVDVYKWPEGGFLYVYQGAAITHRSGISKGVEWVIDALLDGTTWCADAVADHLRKHGHTPVGYSDPCDESKMQSVG